jgi:hypothetical protein
MGAKPGAAFGRSTSGVLDGAASFLVKAGTLANSASHRVTVGAGSASKQVLSTAAAAGRKVKAAIGQDDGLLPVISARGGADRGLEGEASQSAADGSSQVRLLDGSLALIPKAHRPYARLRAASGTHPPPVLRLQRLAFCHITAVTVGSAALRPCLHSRPQPLLTAAQAADGASAGGSGAGGGAQPAADGGHLDFTPSRTQSEPARNLRAVASSTIQQTERTPSRVRPCRAP